MLTSFENGLHAVVAGASGGIGSALVNELVRDPSVARVFALSRRPAAIAGSKVITGTIDYDDPASIDSAARQVKEAGPVDLVIVATGALHDSSGLAPEKSWDALDPDALARVFRVNTIGPAMVVRHFLPLLPGDRRGVFAALTARVGSMADNGLGGWYGYRASKAALNMILKTASIELARKRRDAVCIGLHPGTVDTGLSKPFQAGVAGNRLFTPALSADKLLGVIDRVTPEDTGQVFAWDGSCIPY